MHRARLARRTAPELAHDRNAAQSGRDGEVRRLALDQLAAIGVHAREGRAEQRRRDPPQLIIAQLFSSNGRPSASASARIWLLSPRCGPSSAQTRVAGACVAVIAPAAFNRPPARNRARTAARMCGIAGWYRRGGRPVPQDAIAAACDRLAHRGPDDAGYLVDGDFGFGMRRLSIIDIEGGHQPILSPDGRYAIVFNGEIVNHPALRRELEGGYAFKTDHSDTETILAAYLRWGDDAWTPARRHVSRSRSGTSTRKSLTLARDPLGIKPLFFTEQAGGLAFASEITALRELPGPRVRSRRGRRRRFLLLRPHASAAHHLPPGAPARARARAPHRRRAAKPACGASGQRG